MDHLTIIDLENDDNDDVAAIVVTSTSSSHTTPVTLTKEALGQHHQSLQLHLQTVRSKKRSDNKTSQGTIPALQANHYHHCYNDSDTISTPGARSDDSTSNCSSSVNNNSNISFSEYTPRSSYSELSPSSRRKRSRQMRVNKTNEFTDSFMARPLWKDELTHETRQLLLRKRELESQYGAKKYIVDRTGAIRDTKLLSDERKAFLEKYTELSKMIVSPKVEKKKEDKDSYAFFRRLKYHDDIVKDRNEAIVAKEKERAKKIQEELKIREQEEELRKRQEREEARRRLLEEKRKREQQKKHLHVLNNTVGDIQSPSTSIKRAHDSKIHYPRPKSMKQNPLQEAEQHRLEQKRALLEKRQKLLAPSEKAKKEKYQAPKVLFLRESPRLEPPKPRVKYVAPPLKRKQKKQATKEKSMEPEMTQVEPIEEEQPETVEDEPDTVQPYHESEKRMHIMEEILSTERTYVTQLREIFSIYAEPIEKNELLCSDLHRLVFNDLSVILLLNQEFLNELEATYQQYLVDVENGVASSLIGHLFKRRSPTFKLYTNYINNYEQSLHVIEEQTERNKAFRSFRNSVSQHLIQTNSRNTDLSSFMILPVQRIPRYQLLLRDLIKSTPIDHPEYTALIEAHDSIVDIASYCNSKKAEALNIFKVVEIAEELKIKGLVQPGRRIVKQGELRRDKSKKTTKMYLFNDLLVIVEKGLLNKITQIPLAGNEYEEADTIIVHESTTENSNHDASSHGVGLFLKAVDLGFQRQFICSSRHERDEWIKVIESTQWSSSLTDYNSDSTPKKKKLSSSSLLPKKIFQ